MQQEPFVPLVSGTSRNSFPDGKHPSRNTTKWSRLGFRLKRSQNRMCKRDVPETFETIRDGTSSIWCVRVLCVCKLESGKRKVYYKSKETIETLAQEECCRVHAVPIWYLSSTGISHAFLRLAISIPAFVLHRRMWNWFIFRYNVQYYRCIALPFGWTRSPFWFCILLQPLTRYIRDTL